MRYEIDVNIFSKRVKRLRESWGLDVRDFSLQIGRTQSLISGIENGNRRPSHSTLKEYAAFFGVSIEYLIDNKKEIISSDTNSYTGLDILGEVQDSMFSKRLKTARAQRGLTVEKLSELTGCPEWNILKYENATWEPKPILIWRLSVVLGVSFEWLIGVPERKGAITELFNGLSDEHKKEVLSYAEYLKNKEV